MEKVIIVIDGAYAEEKAEAVKRIVTEQITANGIAGTNVYIEKQLQVMPFVLANRAERNGIYGK